MVELFSLLHAELLLVMHVTLPLLRLWEGAFLGI
jgi:hypothetical protein